MTSLCPSSISKSFPLKYTLVIPHILKRLGSILWLTEKISLNMILQGDWYGASGIYLLVLYTLAFCHQSFLKNVP